MFLIFRISCADSELTKAELKHARARRMKDGDEIFVGDGAGQRVRGVLAGTAVRVEGQTDFREEPRLRLFVAIPEPSRFEWMLQKGTELGATDFFPLLCERSERQSIRMDRCEKIIEEAAVQSGRYVLPRLHEPSSIARALEINGPSAFLLEPGAGNWLLGFGNADFWIGPEGGFSPEEKRLLGVLTPAAVSNHILRVETAAVAALARFTGPAPAPKENK